MRDSIRNIRGYALSIKTSVKETNIDPVWMVICGAGEFVDGL